MRTSLLMLAAMASIAGVAILASSAGAATVTTNLASADTIAASCAAAPGPAVPLNLDLIPSKPVVGHQSVRGAGDDDGCGEDDEHGGRGSDDSEGVGGDD
ncbi:MAG TPA: hypothetical protein VN108_06065 [Marmoricola sp.]|nr:hypothetical protein [Marmoricola sp.]